MGPGGTSELRRRPGAEGVFTDEPRLLGGRCGACGPGLFPRAPGRSRRGSDRTAEHRLARRGTLWTFTVQAFPPKPPYAGAEPFEPYGVGYVELGGEIRVE